MLVNGGEQTLAVDPRSSLLDVLRVQLGPVGAEKGCDHGQCGALHSARASWSMKACCVG